jgi:hypothetical protein
MRPAKAAPSERNPLDLDHLQRGDDPAERAASGAGGSGTVLCEVGWLREMMERAGLEEVEIVTEQTY